jgi:hypothetical protein
LVDDGSDTTSGSVEIIADSEGDDDVMSA